MPNVPDVKSCPVCGIEHEEIEIAVHLSQRHEWAFQDVMDWIREQEELCGR